MVFANILQPLIDAFDAVLQFFHNTLGFSWGWSIVALTVVVRAVLVPLTLRQMRSMQRLAHLQPQLKAIQEKYKDDSQRKNQEVMKFYQENKVNPLASCLPLAAQLPVFISLFYMLRKDLRHDICPAINPPHVPNPKPCGAHVGAAHFLGIPDITNNATGVVLAVLIVLYISSQLLSSFLSMQTADRTQRIMFLALPFIFVGFVVRFPAGLLVYWITTNLWTIVQGYIVRRQVGPIKPPAAATDGDGGKGKGPAPAGASSGGGLFGGLLQRATAASRGDGDGSGRNGGAGREAQPAGAGRTTGRRPSGPPPPPPRKKKKRSGRRR